MKKSLPAIGKYRILKLLGSGSMGRVYKVIIPELNKTAALKLFKPAGALIEQTGVERLKHQFLREARIIANVCHPNIVNIWHLEETDTGLLYIMEYFCRNLGKIMGESYWAEMPSRQIPLQQALDYMRQILEGLSRLHYEGIIHGDIKTVQPDA
jgi:serine/threonine protein kinase